MGLKSLWIQIGSSTKLKHYKLYSNFDGSKIICLLLIDSRDVDGISRDNPWIKKSWDQKSHDFWFEKIQGLKIPGLQNPGIYRMEKSWD